MAYKILETTIKGTTFSDSAPIGMATVALTIENDLDGILGVATALVTIELPILYEHDTEMALFQAEAITEARKIIDMIHVEFKA